MRGIFLGGESLGTLRGELLASAPREAAALLLAGRAGKGDDIRLLVREQFPVPQEGYQIQERLRVVINPSFMMPLLKKARMEQLSLVLTHTHPFAESARFSPVDDEGEQILMPVLFSRTGDAPQGALLLTGNHATGRIWTNGESLAKRISPVVEVGRNVRIHVPDDSERSELGQQFDRSVRALGQQGQATLGSLSIGIVGLGGMGSVVTEQLAHLGVGGLVLLDPDRLEETNLNRVVGATQKDLGRPKVEIAADAARKVNARIDVTAVAGDVIRPDDARRLLSCDFLFCCTDSHGSRAVINQIAYQYMIPAIDLGVVIEVRQGTLESMTGRVQMLAPGLPCLVCDELLDSEEVRRDLLSEEARARDPYIVGAREPQPAVISLNSTVASLGVTMLLAAVAGLPVAARHQLVLFGKGIVRAVAGRPSPHCVVCSIKGAFARGDTWPMVGRPS